jgi:cytoskeletal protein CcmA (bactofilin family)
VSSEAVLGDLIINGVGSSNGGRFQNALISGKGTVNGALDCTFFKCSGTSIVKGEVKSQKIKISGSTKIIGNVSTDELLIEGKAAITGDAFVNKLNVRGSGSVDGSIKGEEIKVQGNMVIGRDCEVETFIAEGRFTVGGLLAAEKIEVYHSWNCRVMEMGGENIRIKQKPNFLRGIFKSVFSYKLKTDLIEGDYIELENTKAKVVRGNHIIIGENCEIDLVEYKDSLRVEKNGVVKEKVQQ